MLSVNTALMVNIVLPDDEEAFTYENSWQKVYFRAIQYNRRVEKNRSTVKQLQFNPIKLFFDKL